MEDASRDDAHVEHRAALRDIRQQQIDERMLAVESRTSPVLECDDTLDCRQVALAERVVLLTKKTFPSPIGLSRIDPIIHDSPADERRHLLSPIPRVHQQSVAVVRAVIDGKSTKSHGTRPYCCCSANTWEPDVLLVLRSPCVGKTRKHHLRHPSARWLPRAGSYLIEDFLLGAPYSCRAPGPDLP